MKKIKKLNIDNIRLILAFFIIAIHTFPFTFINPTFDYMITRVLFRIAVPIYLCITGYFLLPKAQDDKTILIKYLKKISLIYLLSVILYLPLNILNGIPPLNFLRSFFLEGTFYHLWYFPALIFGVVITHSLIKYAPRKYHFIIITILYIIGLFGDNYYSLISNVPIIPSIYKIIFSLTGYTRNFLFYTPIFLFLGYQLKYRKVRIPQNKHLIVIATLSIAMFFEGLLIRYFLEPMHTSMYITLPFLIYYLFSYILKYLSQAKDKKARSIATIIYIIHPFIIAVLNHFINHISILNNSLIFYIAISIISYIASLILFYTLKNVKKIKRHAK